MIDIHCHLLYGVDDGPKERELSIAMLERAHKQGVTHIIVTPHYRRGMFKFDGEKVLERIEELQPYAQRLGICLYPGTEIHVNGDLIQYLEEGKVFSLNGTEYVLTEYEYSSDYSYIFKMTHELLRHGYIPIIAHAERYECLLNEPHRLDELKEIGGLIQCNAAAVIGEDGFKAKQFCKKALKNGWVDFVASDSHDKKFRACFLKDAYRYITSHLGENLAYRVTVKNPEKILGKE